MNPGLVTTFVIGIIILLAIAIAIFCSVRNKKYREYVLDHSEAIKKLKQINSKYLFYDIPSYDYEHSYDNMNFYTDISCRDYLIYQLVHDKFGILKAMNQTVSNKALYKKYKEETIKECTLNIFDEETNLRSKRKIEKTEEKIFLALLEKPTIEFFIKVKLTLTNINGVYQTSKNNKFFSNEIRDLITLVDQKNGTYYRNRDVWDALCRVERGKVTNKMRFAIYKRDGNRCQCCGRRTNNLEIDHIVPIARGGKSTYDNLQTLCHRCNMRKGSNIERYR